MAKIDLVGFSGIEQKKLKSGERASTGFDDEQKKAVQNVIHAYSVVNFIALNHR